MRPSDCVPGSCKFFFIHFSFYTAVISQDVPQVDQSSEKMEMMSHVHA
jgi:hypothetical protein